MLERGDWIGLCTLLVVAVIALWKWGARMSSVVQDNTRSNERMCDSHERMTEAIQRMTEAVKESSETAESTNRRLIEELLANIKRR